MLFPSDRSSGRINILFLNPMIVQFYKKENIDLKSFLPAAKTHRESRIMPVLSCVRVNSDFVMLARMLFAYVFYVDLLFRPLLCLLFSSFSTLRDRCVCVTCVRRYI